MVVNVSFFMPTACDCSDVNCYSDINSTNIVFPVVCITELFVWGGGEAR